MIAICFSMFSRRQLHRCSLAACNYYRVSFSATLDSFNHMWTCKYGERSLIWVLGQFIFYRLGLMCSSHDSFGKYIIIIFYTSEIALLQNILSGMFLVTNKLWMSAQYLIPGPGYRVSYRPYIGTGYRVLIWTPSSFTEYRLSDSWFRNPCSGYRILIPYIKYWIPSNWYPVSGLMNGSNRWDETSNPLDIQYSTIMEMHQSCKYPFKWI